MLKILPGIIPASIAGQEYVSKTAAIGSDLRPDFLSMTGSSFGFPAGRPALRVMLMGSQCMAFECLREAMGFCGIEGDFCSLEDRIAKVKPVYDVFVLFLMKYVRGMPALIQQRLSELRSCIPNIPTVALLEDGNADATALSQLGFSTVIIGLPSFNFALTAIRLLSAGGASGLMAGAAPEPDAADREPPHGGEAGGAGSLADDVSFTRRELELINLLRQGLQNKVIAHQLAISESTVKAHLRSILTKLHARNRTHAMFMLSQDATRKSGAAPAAA